MRRPGSGKPGDGREDYLEAAERLWQNMAGRRMHITGGVGAYADDEKFGDDYALPNDAYLETCAAIAAAFFHRNMNLALGQAKYVDELERALFNGVLAGASLSGDRYFYENPSSPVPSAVVGSGTRALVALRCLRR